MLGVVILKATTEGAAAAVEDALSYLVIIGTKSKVVWNVVVIFCFVS